MNLSNTQKLLEGFLKPTEREIFEKFLKLPGATRDPGKTHDPKWVYIPGKRPDRVLCVAHADTVHADKPLDDLLWIGDVACRIGAVSGGGWGKGPASGPLGADDRAGCAMMYDLWDGSHSLLITTGEERGLVGARAAVADMKAELEKHQFAVQVDRRGDRQAVFYDVGTEKFKAYITSTLSGFDYEKRPWKEWEGSSTDIRHICGEIYLCGVNLSAGFWNEHSENEMLLLGAWLHTRTVLRRLLKQDKLPQFKFQRRYQAPLSYQGGVQYYGGHGSVSIFTSDIEDLIKQCDQPNLSGKAKKKLAKQVRKFAEKGKIQRWQAVRMMDKLYPISSEENKQQLALLPAPTPIADSYLSRDDSLNNQPLRCGCGALVADPGGLHKSWCSKFPNNSTGRERKCIHGLSLAMFCKQCEEGSIDNPRTTRCPGCGNMYVHKSGCTEEKLDDKATGMLTETGKIVAKKCDQCGEQPPKHNAACIWGSPNICGYCHLKDGQHTVICPLWRREQEQVGDGFCSECFHNIKVTGTHGPHCSKDINSHVRVKAIKPDNVTVHQKIEPMEMTICVHQCPDCASSWKHARLPVNSVGRHSRGCMIQFIAGCPKHSEDSKGLVQWYEAKVKEEVDKRMAKQQGRKEIKVLPPATPDPNDVSAQLREMGSWD